MSQVAEPIAGQRMRVAAATTAGVAAVLLVQDLIGGVTTLLVGYAQAEYNSGMYLGYLWQSLGYGVAIVLAFALGVGVCLWWFTPVTERHGLKTVVVRGAVAAAAGSAVVLLVNFAFGLIGPLSGTGSLFANSFPAPDWGGVSQALAMAVQAGFGAFVTQAPVVLLVVLLAWMWRGRHPSPQPVMADAGEV